MSDVTVRKTGAGDGTRHAVPDIEQSVARRFAAIRRKAFEFFEQRGGEPGNDLDDWLRAEREVLDSLAGELTETDACYTAEVKLPGFEAGDVHVTATPGEIVVEARREREEGTETEYRSFTLAGPIEVEQVKATLSEGRLCVEAPKLKALAKRAADLAG
jgi:HSP20 family molecular chaperone IbpA